MKIASFDRDTVGDFRKTLEADLKVLGEKYGVTFKVGNAKFARTGESCEYKVEAMTIGAKPMKKTDEETSLEFYADSLMLQGIDITKEFTIPRLGTMKVTGYRRRAPVRPFVAVCKDDGKGYILTLEDIRRYAAKKVA
jgi:hypothetical protein